MVVLNKIYTRTGDKGDTALGTGSRVPKYNTRIAAYGTVDEANSFIGVARQHLGKEDAEVDQMLVRIQNDMFDLGADLCTPDTGEKLDYEPLRISAKQVERLESEIDQLNGELEPLRSFILPGGKPGAAALHVARTVARRAERLMVELAAVEDEKVGNEALHYINRLSDFLFVAGRYVNDKGKADVLWTPGQNH
jgi:cob(I)alamin adenosyltransferase